MAGMMSASAEARAKQSGIQIPPMAEVQGPGIGPKQCARNQAAGTHSPA
jgi:hypothetical protein